MSSSEFMIISSIGICFVSSRHSIEMFGFGFVSKVFNVKVNSTISPPPMFSRSSDETLSA